MLVRISLAACAGWLLLASSSFGAPPIITRVSPPALQAGGSTKVIVEGSNLNDTLRLVVPFAITEQKFVGKPVGNRVELEVNLPADVAAGLVPLRVATDDGISSALIVSIDKLATIPFAPKIETLPLAMYGDLPGAQVLKTSFTGKKDQPLVVEVEAQRLGSSLRPTVRLYDPRGRQIAWSPPRDEAGGDARCEAKLPLDGVYEIELHDHLYKAQGLTTFRLKVGSFTYAGTVLPLAVQLGTKGQVEPLLTNAAQGWEVDLSATTLRGEMGARIPGDAASGAQPRLIISDVAEFKDKLPENAAVPLAISARASDDGKEQTYRFAVAPGKKLRFDVLGHRFGSPIDAVLTLRNEKGEQLATNDDRPDSRDPFLEFAVPGNVTTLVAAVKDMHDRSGPDYFYRLEVREADQPEVSGSLDLTAVHVPAGGNVVLPIQLSRQNYSGQVVIEPQGLPAGVALAGGVIPPGVTQALLTFSAPAEATGSGTFSLAARAEDGSFARRVLFAAPPAAKTMPWLRYEAGVAVSKPQPLQIAWQPNPSAEIVGGTKLIAPVTLTRQAGATGNVRLKLLTTQPMPKKKIKEKNQDKEVDDIDRAIRLEGAPTLMADATQLDVVIHIPADLPPGQWDLALEAELLSADGKSVIAKAASTVHRFNSVLPFKLQLAGEAKAEGRAGLGETGFLAGKIERAAGFEKPITVMLTGLPKEIIAPTVVLAANQSEFSLPLKFPFGTKAGEVKNVKLVAVSEPGTPAAVRSNEIAVALNIVAGEKPTAEAPLAIFDENEAFIAALSEGDGMASVDAVERYSGKIAVKVTPNQKFNPQLPGLGVKIRENPGPGEYRYLRFAWKKKGGDTVVLQLNHDGQWGPGGSGREGAKFRYHAGPSGEQYTASLELSNKIPNDFEVVTRDLFADFGEFTLNGISLSPVNGSYAVFDHLYLGRSQEDFSLAKTEKE